MTGKDTWVGGDTDLGTGQITTKLQKVEISSDREALNCFG